MSPRRSTIATPTTEKEQGKEQKHTTTQTIIEYEKEKQNINSQRLLELESTIQHLSQTLAQKLATQQIRESEIENDRMRIRDVERSKYLALLNKLEQMNELQDDQKQKLKLLQEKLVIFFCFFCFLSVLFFIFL